MTAFLWVSSLEAATADANAQGFNSWSWYPNKEAILARDPLNYDVVYFKSGNYELEREFARIQREKRQKWLC